MLLGKLDKVKKYYGDKLVLDIDNFEILEGDRIGLVGVNGAGKTTFLRTLIKEEVVNEGSIILTDSYAYIAQKEESYYGYIDGKIKGVLNAPNEYKDNLSGGEKGKIKIARALSENKKLIIADEPTANLDNTSILELEKMLEEHKGALLIVSHDREFLDSLCNIIVEIEKGKINIYKGNYSNYIVLKEEERKSKEREYEKYISEKKRLEVAISSKIKKVDSIKKTPKRMGNSEARLHKMGGQSQKKKIDRNIKALRTRISKLEVKEGVKEPKELRIIIQDGQVIKAKNLIEAQDLNLSVGNKVLIENTSFKIKRGRKVAIIGDNGTGKTTLIKKIVENNSDNIKINNKVSIGYFDQSQSSLKDEESILQNIKDSSSYDETFIRIKLGGFGFKNEEVYKKVDVLSGGEKVKVLLCKILLADNNLLILDEPTNYLDIKAIKALEDALINTDKTLILVSHDRNIIKNVCDYILEIKDKIIIEFDGDYEEFILNRNKEQVSKVVRKDNERLMILENKLSETISLLSIEKDENKKMELDNKYKSIIEEIKLIRK